MDEKIDEARAGDPGPGVGSGRDSNQGTSIANGRRPRSTRARASASAYSAQEQRPKLPKPSEPPPPCPRCNAGADSTKCALPCDIVLRRRGVASTQVPDARFALEQVHDASRSVGVRGKPLHSSQLQVFAPWRGRARNCASMCRFCYYNNASVNQPRYFCKVCERHWTGGGTLRAVDPGAGRRRDKRSRGSSASRSRSRGGGSAIRGLASRSGGPGHAGDSGLTATDGVTCSIHTAAGPSYGAASGHHNSAHHAGQPMHAQERLAWLQGPASMPPAQSRGLSHDFGVGEHGGLPEYFPSFDPVRMCSNLDSISG